MPTLKDSSTAVVTALATASFTTTFAALVDTTNGMGRGVKVSSTTSSEPVEAARASADGTGGGGDGRSVLPAMCSDMLGKDHAWCRGSTAGITLVVGGGGGGGSITLCTSAVATAVLRGFTTGLDVLSTRPTPQQDPPLSRISVLRVMYSGWYTNDSVALARSPGFMRTPVNMTTLAAWRIASA